tara:strand:+ start:229 stop:1128 length:900 start_codon:yes stop_codon:yes gene_type:complete
MKHLAGIIPVANLQTDFDFAYPEILMPLNNGFTAIQKSVVECAYAGCSTIWIVANPDLAPIVRKTVGDWIYDPVYLGRTKYGQGSEHRREIPIYYCNILPKNIDRRDSYGWSVLSGVYASWLTANKISKWIIPNKYYISFPMAVYDIYQLRKNRKLIADNEKNFFLSFNGKTVKDNYPLSFTMFGEDYLNCRRDVNAKTTKQYHNTREGEKYPTRKLPIEDRWSARGFSLSEVFAKIAIDGAHTHTPESFFDISTWEGYKQYMTSDFTVETPYHMLTKRHTHVKIPYKHKLQEGNNESE